MFDWMAWTLPVAVFFTCIVLMLAGMTVWELKSPTVLRNGFLPIATTRGDRLFIGLLDRGLRQPRLRRRERKDGHLVRAGAGAFDLDRLRRVDAFAGADPAQGLMSFSGRRFPAGQS